MNKMILFAGVFLLLIGVFTNVYSVTTTQSHLWGLYSTSDASNPYSTFSVPLFIGGIVLIIVGTLIKEGKR